MDCLMNKGGQIVTFYGIIFRQLFNQISNRCAYAIYIVGATHALKHFHQHHLINISFRLWFIKHSGIMIKRLDYHYSKISQNLFIGNR